MDRKIPPPSASALLGADGRPVRSDGSSLYDASGRPVNRPPEYVEGPSGLVDKNRLAQILERAGRTIQAHRRLVTETFARVHPEALCLMQYRDMKTSKVEVLWNSRDGVTPYTIGSPDGNEAVHVGVDLYAPEYLPAVGDRIFINTTREMAEAAADRIMQEVDLEQIDGDPDDYRRSIVEDIIREHTPEAGALEAMDEEQRAKFEAYEGGPPSVVVVDEALLAELTAKREERRASDPFLTSKVNAQAELQAFLEEDRAARAKRAEQQREAQMAEKRRVRDEAEMFAGDQRLGPIGSPRVDEDSPTNRPLQRGDSVTIDGRKLFVTKSTRKEVRLTYARFWNG